MLSGALEADVPTGVERATLANGLRVVVLPGPPSSAVGLALHYDVGTRNEVPSRTGFAHLFEHLMFQGTERVGQREFAYAVESAGGSYNGSTASDYTSYHVVMPASGLERGLFLLADQMAGPMLTEQNLANQIDVVKEEVLGKILDVPLGGFPTFEMPGALFSSFPNAHNGFGSFGDLDAATLADAAQFFETHYAPANAVLCIAGAADRGRAFGLAERHFGPLPARPAPQRPDLDEPRPAAERRVVRTDRRSPVDAVGVGWRVPDPADLAEYLPYVLLADMLGDGPTSRLHRRLVESSGAAIHVGCRTELLGGTFMTRHPSAFVVDALVASGSRPDDVVALIEDELTRIAEEGCSDGELARLIRWGTVKNLSQQGSPLELAFSAAGHEIVHGRAELGSELPWLLEGVSGEDLRVAAASLAARRDATVVIEGSKS